MFIKSSSVTALALVNSFSKRSQPGALLKSIHLSIKKNDIVKVPTMAESISEGTLKAWSKQVGDHVKADEEVAIIETDKIDVTVNAPFDGIIKEVFASEEDTVEVGNKLFDITPASKDSSNSSSAQQPQEKKSESKKSSKSAANSSAANKPTNSNTSNSTVTNDQAPTSVTSAVPKSENSLPKTPEGTSTTKSKDTSPAPPPNSSQSSSNSANRSESRVKMNRMRLRIAERLKESQNTAASLTTFNTIDMTKLIALRSQHKEDVLKRHGVKLGYMSAFAKASAIALREIPAANAAIEGDSIVYRDYVDLSVAVATPKGLVTPVIRNVEGMPSFVDIERAIADAGKKARDGKLTMEDMSGGTFTISNGGVFGSLFGTPIINLPQSAVLGMHAIVDTPIVVKKDGKKEIAIRPVMTVALTYDHRLLDGREAVTLLVRIKQLIEDPEAMLVM